MLVFCLENLMKVYYWSSCRRLSLVSSNYTYVTSFAANVKVIYLASVNDRATVVRFLKH